MSVQSNTELITRLLQDLPRKYKDPRMQFVYEHGYLISILATLAHNDSWVHTALVKILNKRNK
jgi:hypothetical protein